MASSSEPSLLDRKREFATLYQDVCGNASVASARYGNAAGTCVRVSLSQRDLSADATRRFARTFVKTEETSGDWCSVSPFAVQEDGVVARLVSPSGRRLALVRAAEPKAGGKEARPCYRVEVVEAGGGALVTSVPTEGKHGAVYCSSTLGGLTWSRCERYVAYVADENPRATETLWAFMDEDKEEESGKKGKKGKLVGGKYEYREHLGETLYQAFHPQVFVVDVEERRVRKLQGVPKDMVTGHVTWHPDNSGVVFVGWSSEPRHLGLRHYNTRKSGLYYAPLVLDEDAETDGVTLLSGDDHSPMCPRFSPDGKQLVYVTAEKTWLHTSCSKLRAVDLASGEIRTVVDVVRDLADADAFPGLWPASTGLGLISDHVWLSDNVHIVCDSAWGTREALLLINTQTGSVRRIPTPSAVPLASATVQHIHGTRFLARVSNINTPAALYELDVGAYLSEDADLAPAAEQWTLVCESARPRNPDVRAKLEGITFEILRVQPEVNADASTLPFEAMLVRPAAGAESDAGTPLVVFPHGGPHSADSTQHWPGLAFLVCSGFAVLTINYRGSRGFGQSSLESLPGHVGTQDVSDVMLAFEAAVARGGIDRERVSVFGGSHGGFLTTHLIGQFPDTFRAAAARNPVTNVAGMAHSTDIPSWCYSECGLPFSTSEPPTAEQYRVMFEMSPIAHAAKVKTPLMLMLGDADRRCPMTQGIDYGKILRGRGVRCRIVVYPKNQHSLNDSVGTEADSWTSSALWLHGWFDEE